jgi:RNA polymerase sigma-70 factor, ECF subfamily
LRAAYAAHGEELYGFAARVLGDRGLAEEAVQETFLRAWRAADRFDPKIASLRTWLFSIIRNVVSDLWRAREARAPAPVGPPVTPDDDPLERAVVAWQVEEALRRIGEDHRRVIIETYYQGRSCGEVAAALRIPQGTVRSRLYYGLRALRLALEETGWAHES